MSKRNFCVQRKVNLIEKDNTGINKFTSDQFLFSLNLFFSFLLNFSLLTLMKFKFNSGSYPSVSVPTYVLLLKIVSVPLLLLNAVGHSWREDARWRASLLGEMPSGASLVEHLWATKIAGFGGGRGFGGKFDQHRNEVDVIR